MRLTLKDQVILWLPTITIYSANLIDFYRHSLVAVDFCESAKFLKFQLWPGTHTQLDWHWN